MDSSWAMWCASRRWWWTAGMLLAGMGVNRSARAEEPEEPDALVWHDESWPRFHPIEYGTTGAMIVGVGVGLFAVPQREDVWRGGILFDDWMRGRLVLGNRSDRDTATLVGDIFYWSLTAYPAVVDLGVAALLVHRSPDVALQMFLIDAQAFAFTGLVSTYTQKLIGRNRPFADKCAGDPGYDSDCDDPATRSQSLISGHTAMAYTGAGLVCLHHAHLPLYGGGAADALACSMSMAGATIVAWSRVVADRHYLSDALAGASVGILSGYLVPELLHYRFRTPLAVHTDTTSAVILPVITPTSTALMVTGFVY